MAFGFYTCSQLFIVGWCIYDGFDGAVRVMNGTNEVS